MTPLLYTVGHSNRSAWALVELLLEQRIERLVDVRRYPGSRRNPQFARGPLERALAARGIAYRHEPRLGGHRAPREGSPHTGLEDPAARGYADHMLTEEFRSAADELVELAGVHRCAVMCAEREPDRCHRRLLADYCELHGARVEHLLGPGVVARHAMDPAATLAADGSVRYAGGQLDLFP